MTWKARTFLACLVFAFCLTGCKVHVDKGADGEDKNVRVDTPLGGVHVKTDQTTASDLGLPIYPGSQLVDAGDKNKSADVQLGFGEWQLRVRVVTYSTADSEEKVAAFYKDALGRYGNVITCQHNAAVGTPSVTSEGLTCSDSNGKGASININDSKNGVNIKDGLQLKAGSRRHQHIVGFEEPADGKTRFALVSLDLPQIGSSNEQSN